MLFLPLFLLASCATGPVRHAETFHKRGHVFQGPRQITISRAVGDDANALDSALSRFNFRVSRQIPGVFTEVASRYVITVKGVCGARGISSRYWQRTAADYSVEVNLISADVFDTETNERVFAAHLDDDGDCPDAFFADVASALARNWEADNGW